MEGLIYVGLVIIACLGATYVLDSTIKRFAEARRDEDRRAAKAAIRRSRDELLRRINEEALEREREWATQLPDDLQETFDQHQLERKEVADKEKRIRELL